MSSEQWRGAVTACVSKYAVLHIVCHSVAVGAAVAAMTAAAVVAVPWCWLRHEV